MEEESGNRISFFAKNKTTCPSFNSGFYREDVRTGRGRLIAGELANDLRRLYEPSKKFGEVQPLVYTITVCPVCYYAAFPSDFENLPEKSREAIAAQAEKRSEDIKLIFDEVEFREPRTLKEGIASYYFAVMCYDHFPHDFSPTIKQGIASLRAAWLLSDMHRRLPNENYDYLSQLFFNKARFFYTLAVEYEGNGRESVSRVGHLGPDLDKNYGYDGVLYLSALLEYLYGSREPLEKRIKALILARRTVGRIFGMGRASKDKPSVLLDKAKELYAKIGEELEMSGQGDA